MQTLRHREYLLRPLNSSDAGAVCEAVKESVSTVGTWMTWATANYSIADALTWIEISRVGHANKTSYEFGIFEEVSGKLVGAAGLNQFNRVNNFCNLGYWVRQTAQRRGAATAAVIALKNFAFSELHLARVEIVMAVENKPSYLLAQKTGASLECEARNRLQLHGKPINAYVFSLVPPSEA